MIIVRLAAGLSGLVTGQETTPETDTRKRPRSQLVIGSDVKKKQNICHQATKYMANSFPTVNYANSTSNDRFD
jgi:hypothetical protein